jgi:hypothetical protein
MNPFAQDEGKELVDKTKLNVLSTNLAVPL